MTEDTEKLSWNHFEKVRTARYRINMSWSYLFGWIEEHECNLDPSWQRFHVWNTYQQRRYIEWCLKGGASGREFYFNDPDWFKGERGKMVLVDGKQRIRAIERFMHDELEVFGGVKRSNFKKRLGMQSCCGCLINVNDFKKESEVIQWYIDNNSGGSAHTEDEIVKAKVLLKKALEEETK